MNLQQIPAQYHARAESILDTLQSYFVDMPRGTGFLDSSDFKTSFERLRTDTSQGMDFTPATVLDAVRNDSRTWVVLRTIAGVTPPEAAALTMEAAAERGVQLSIGAELARTVDARCKRAEAVLLQPGSKATKREELHSSTLEAMVLGLTEVIVKGPGKVAPDRVHRLDKVDTRDGVKSLRVALADEGDMYAELLCERILGRPFATHRDAVSDLVGDSVEEKIMDVLEAHGVSAQKTGRRAKVETFPQAPDIIAPFTGFIDDVEVALESKMAEDDGTARDKVSRVVKLRANEDKRVAEGLKRRQIVSVLEGRGFAVREPDLLLLLEACDGHVYTASECQALVEPDGPFARFVK